MMKPEKIKCFFCHKKLSVTNSFPCQCGNTYCSNHRYIDIHNCTQYIKIRLKKKKTY